MDRTPRQGRGQGGRFVGDTLYLRVIDILYTHQTRPTKTSFPLPYKWFLTVSSRPTLVPVEVVCYQPCPPPSSQESRCPVPPST